MMKAPIDAYRTLGGEAIELYDNLPAALEKFEIVRAEKGKKAHLREAPGKLFEVSVEG
jgi:hypothetical protein